MGRVKKAREFSEDILQVYKWLRDEDKPQGRLWAQHVSGDMHMDFRSQTLKRLKNVGPDEIGIVPNARCLGEGVDAPTLDAIIFNDPKRSEIDIIQAVGRGIRNSQDKRIGTIVIPVFIDETGNAEEALASSAYRPIFDVIQALKSHDDRLPARLEQLQIARGAGKRVSKDDLKSLNIHFNSTFVDEDFAQAIRTYLVENTTESWLFWYGLLQAYVKEHGDCLVPAKYRTADGFKLGQWVTVQRTNKDTMDADRRQLLEKVPGWSWGVLSDLWEQRLSRLKEFVEKYGHSRVPYNFKTDDGFELGVWVSVQRQNKDTLKPNQWKRLEDLPGWLWNGRSDWEEGLSHLKEHVDEHGHCRVPFETNDSFRLRPWVSYQRQNKDKLQPEQQRRLEELPGWLWNPKDDRWEIGFSHAKAFAEKYGHCQVPPSYKTDNRYNLYTWIKNQKKRKDRLQPEQQRRLEELPGWLWRKTKRKK